MRVLDRYIARTVIGGSLMALFIIVSLNVVFQFVDETGSVGQGSYSMLDAFAFTLLTTPQRAYEAWPIATLIGALVGLGGLAARHELVAMRAAGVSVFGVARAVVIGGVVLALVAAALGEWLAPQAERLAQTLRSSAMDGQVSSGLEGGFWVRDRGNYLHVSRAPSADVIEGVTIYEVHDGRLRAVIRAQRGQYEKGGWQLAGVHVTHVSRDGITEDAESRRFIRSDLKPEMLGVVVVPPQTLPLTDLATYIDYLQRNGLESARYRLAFWEKLVTPLATVTMLLLTVPLVFGSLRSVGAGQQMFVGVLIGIAFFLLNRLLGNAGIVYGLPPVVSALAPTAVFLALAVAGLARTR